VKQRLCYFALVAQLVIAAGACSFSWRSLDSDPQNDDYFRA